MPVSLTRAAAQRLKQLSLQAGAPRLLRVAVDGGGCSGFKYRLELIDAPEADDQIISLEGQSAVIDLHSAPLLCGSMIDFVEDLTGSQFKVINPNAASSCGCGLSFSL